jgi:hypothetical protein
MNPPGQLIDDLRLLQAPGPWWTQWWAITLAAAVVCSVAFYFLLRWRRHAAHRALRGGAPAAAAAFEDALAELERLFALVEEERSRPYAIESSAIIRRYLERRFEIRAPRRSTEEFLLEARHSPKLGESQQSLLGEFLGCCDFLKFARGLATREELEKLHRSAIDFVSATRAVPVPPGELAAR